MNGSSIRVSSWLQRSVAHGPGERFVIWVQGCSLGCPGCFSSSTHGRDGGELMEVQRLADVIRATKNIEGITISGGEPFQQANPLAGLTDIVRGTGLTVMCYTGFSIVELRRQRCDDVERLLANIDVLVDGRFVRSKSSILRWRGSSNQNIHWLTPAYDHLREEDDATSDVELITTEDAMTATGIWPKAFIEAFRDLTKGDKDDSTQT
jgi:anaerobic ribonucleoside-triphosphate reductase activating protein